MIYLEGSDFFVYFVNLPPKVKGFIVPNDDSTFSMYLNVRLDFEGMLDAYIHEYLHMIREDHYSDRSIWEIEAA